MRSPLTYTREDIIEINCHGGQAVLDRVFALVCYSGARPAEPGEFTKRAFLNGRMDLAQAEAVADIINATTEASLRVAMSHLDGHFSEKIEKERLALIDVLKDVEAFVDFQEEHLEGLDLNGMDARIDKIMASLKDMLLTAGTGMMIKEGITCVICGKPNAGKSSLLNMLLKVERAIVTHVPGTTRDTIEESVDISGIAVKLVDTAGITHSRDIVEKKGIEKTKGYIKRGDLILFVMDMSRPFDAEDRAIIKISPKGGPYPLPTRAISGPAGPERT
jgi:tRNA modification GTPase